MVSHRPIRLLWLSVLAVLIASGLFYNARWLFAESYLRFAEQRTRSVHALETSQQALGIALKLQPFSARAMQARANDDLLLGHPEPALAEFESALTLAPADAYLWRDYALALIYAGIFDARLERAVTQAQSWAHKSQNIHIPLAVIGLRVFDQSSPALRSLWRKSILFAFRYKPDVVISTAYISEQELLLCDGSAIPKPETNNWCAAARWRHGLCSTSVPGVAGSCFGKQERRP